MYDLVFVTHLPSFYKTNLYNEIARELKVLVIFISNGAKERKKDFCSNNFNFDYEILFNGDLENRSILKNCLFIRTLFSKINFKLVVLGGWDLPEFWVANYFISGKKGLALESSIFDCDLEGFKGFLKRKFISRFNVAFPSGEPHIQLLKKLGYKGKYFKTLGVGIINRNSKSIIKRDFNGKFLFVGRLVKEKNIEILIQAFRELPLYQLSIVGNGYLKSELSKDLPGNVIILDHVENSKIGEVYLNHSIFILPSLREPWGLVVDEAIYFGLPLLISNKVGCSRDLVKEDFNGYLFNPFDKEDLVNNIKKISNEENFKRLHKEVNSFDLVKRDKFQVNAYCTALSLLQDTK